MKFDSKIYVKSNEVVDFALRSIERTDSIMHACHIIGNSAAIFSIELHKVISEEWFRKF